MLLILISYKVCTLCAVANANKHTNLNVSNFKSKELRGSRSSAQFKTTSVLQIELYFSLNGLFLKTPLKKRLIEGSLP